MRSTFACLTTIVLLMGACPAGDDSDTNASDTDPTGSTDPTDPATTDPATTDPATTDPATTDPATTDPATTDPATTAGPDPDTGTDTGTSECPPEKDDDACALCTKENCCAELMACQANPDCDCVVTCVGEMGIAMQAACEKKCGVEETPAEAAPLQQCVVTGGCIAKCV